MTDETRESAAVLCSALASDRAMMVLTHRHFIAEALGTSDKAQAFAGKVFLVATADSPMLLWCEAWALAEAMIRNGEIE